MHSDDTEPSAGFTRGNGGAGMNNILHAGQHGRRGNGGTEWAAMAIHSGDRSQGLLEGDTFLLFS